MTKEQIAETVKDIVKAELTLDSVSEDDSLVALNADSLDAVEIIMELEDKFAFTIPDEDAEPLNTVRKIIEYVEKRLAT